MKKILCILFILIFTYLNGAYATLIEGNVSMSDVVPTDLYGTWKVDSVCTRSTNKNLFESYSTDIWTLSRNGETVTLMNPISGARADVDVREVKGRSVKFEKRSFYTDEESVETPILNVQGDNFTGVDRISIKRYKEGKLIREDYVEYKVRGTKISGASAGGILGMGI